jgi:hypothetical protein
MAERRCRPRRATANRTEEICVHIGAEKDYKRYLDEYPLPQQPEGKPA